MTGFKRVITEVVIMSKIHILLVKDDRFTLEQIQYETN